METLETEGIVLKILPYQDYNRIVTLFTPEGLIKIFAKGGKKTFLRQNELAVLTQGVYIVQKGRGDFHQVKDATIVNQHLRLRERFENLEVADKMIRAILETQWPGKAVPRLYALFQLFIEQIPQFADPDRLMAAFYLKLLKHEGILQLTGCCCLCQKPTESRYGGEQFCSTHLPEGALLFSTEEELQLIHIAESRSFHFFAEMAWHRSFSEKVSSLFAQAIQKT